MNPIDDFTSEGSVRLLFERTGDGLDFWSDANGVA